MMLSFTILCALFANYSFPSLWREKVHLQIVSSFFEFTMCQAGSQINFCLLRIWPAKDCQFLTTHWDNRNTWVELDKDNAKNKIKIGKFAPIKGQVEHAHFNDCLRCSHIKAYRYWKNSFINCLSKEEQKVGSAKKMKRKAHSKLRHLST